MFNVEEHVIYKLRNAHMQVYPFPHFFVENVFPDEFYQQFLDSLPGDEDYTQMSDGYPDRAFGPKEIPAGLEFMGEERFMSAVLSIFNHWIKKNYPNGSVSVAADLRLVRDKKGYFIGPHTDAAWKMVSLLFYLPHTAKWAKHGTSIYVPNDPSFRCTGGPHYSFENFKEVYAAPFIPNSCFGFWKTDNSFHGVEEVTSDIHRNVLLYNVYDDSKIPGKSVKLGELSTESPGAENGNGQSSRGGKPIGE